MESLAQLIQKDPEDVKEIVRELPSVLAIPSDWKRSPIEPLHLSPRDFLVHPRNSNQPFYVNKQKRHQELALQCLDLLSDGKHLKMDICGVRMPGTTRLEISRGRIETCLPPLYRYACLFRAQHLKESGCRILEEDRVHKFLKVHFLHWLEALSLLGELSQAITFVDTLCMQARPEEGSTEEVGGPVLYDFLADAGRFIRHCFDGVCLAPLQVYSSALLFAPQESLVRQQFRESMPRWATRGLGLNGPERFPDPCIQTLEFKDSPGNWTGLFDLSRDGTLFVGVWQYPVRIETIDVRTGKSIQQSLVAGSFGIPSSFSLSPTGVCIATISGNNKLDIWDVATGKLRQTAHCEAPNVKPGDHVYIHSFSPDGRYILIYGDTSIFLWEACPSAAGGQPSWEATTELTSYQHTLAVYKRFSGYQMAIFSPDAQYVAGCGLSSSVSVYDVATKSLYHEFPTRSCYECVAFSSDGKYLAGGGRQLTVWGLQSKSQLWTKSLDGRCAYDIAFSPSPLNQSIAVVLDNGNLIAQDWIQEKESQRVGQHSVILDEQHIRYLPGGQHILSAFQTNGAIILKVWDLNVIQAKGGHEEDISALLLPSKFRDQLLSVPAEFGGPRVDAKTPDSCDFKAVILGGGGSDVHDTPSAKQPTENGRQVAILFMDTIQLWEDTETEGWKCTFEPKNRSTAHPVPTGDRFYFLAGFYPAMLQSCDREGGWHVAHAQPCLNRMRFEVFVASPEKRYFVLYYQRIPRVEIWKNGFGAGDLVGTVSDVEGLYASVPRFSEFRISEDESYVEFRAESKGSRVIFKRLDS